jgi:hypothetical protein
MFSNIYFLSHICRKNVILINEITFSVQTRSLVQVHPTFGIIFHSGKYSSALEKWQVLLTTSEEICLLGKSLILVLVFENFTNSRLDLISD